MPVAATGANATSCSWRFVDEPVADAAYGADEPRFASEITEGPTKIADMNVHDSVVADIVPPPDGLEQLAARENTSRLSGERSKQVEFERRH